LIDFAKGNHSRWQRGRETETETPQLWQPQIFNKFPFINVINSFILRLFAGIQDEACHHAALIIIIIIIIMIIIISCVSRNLLAPRRGIKRDATFHLYGVSCGLGHGEYERRKDELL